MLISKKNLAVLAAADKDKYSNYSLNSVKIDPEKMEICASNGHSLWISKLPTVGDDEFPDAGIESAVSSKECFLLPAKALEKAAKNLPKNGGTFLSILQNIQVLTDSEYHHLVTTDLETVDDVKVKHQSREYPNIDVVRKSVEGKAAMNVGLSVKELERMVKVAKKHGEERSTKPVVVESGDLTGYIMPFKLDK
jgi:hypothetical protein